MEGAVLLAEPRLHARLEEQLEGPEALENCASRIAVRRRLGSKEVIQALCM